MNEDFGRQRWTRGRKLTARPGRLRRAQVDGVGRVGRPARPGRRDADDAQAPHVGGLVRHRPRGVRHRREPPGRQRQSVAGFLLLSFT